MYTHANAHSPPCTCTHILLRLSANNGAIITPLAHRVTQTLGRSDVVQRERGAYAVNESFSIHSRYVRQREGDGKVRELCCQGSEEKKRLNAA